MIEYIDKKVETTKKSIEYVYSQLKGFIFLVGLFFAFSLYLIIMGYSTNEYQSVKDGWIDFVCCFLASMFVFFMFFFSRKKFLAVFKNCINDGIIKWFIKKDGDDFILKKENSDNEFRFCKEDIKKEIITKNFIFITLKDNKLLDFPKNEEIITLLHS